MNKRVTQDSRERVFQT